MAAEWKAIRVGKRAFRRQLEKAIRRSWMRALAELITKADDSYTRLEAEGYEVDGDIVVEYEKNRDEVRFYVVDEAEGMTADRLEEVFEEYGGDVAAGEDARGFFNRGAKDALLAMEGGYEESICEGEYAKVDLRISQDGEPQVRITGPRKASASRRKQMGIVGGGNGTLASFALPAAVQAPQFETVRSALASFWMLRKIVSPDNERRRLILIFRDREEEIIFASPIAETLIDRQVMPLEVEGYKKLRLEVTLKKAEEDLDQSLSDRRVGGMLIIDEGEAVLDLTMGRFDRDPAAGPFYGEVRIKKGFKRFLKQQEDAGMHVLSDERNGLERHHPWVDGLLREIENVLEPHVERERKARAAGAQELSETERKHHDKIIEELNRIAEEETQKAWEGIEDDDDVNPPASGLEIRPAHIVIAEGTQRFAAVVADFGKVQPGDLIYVEDEPDCLDLEPDEIKVEQDDNDKVFIGYFRISGGATGETGKIVAITNDTDLSAEATFEVVQEAYPQFEGDMAFVPEASSVVDQKPATLSLLVRTDVIGPGDEIEVVSSDDDKVKVLIPTIEVDAQKVRGGVARVGVRVRGQRIGNTATLTATSGHASPATVQVHVRSQAAPPKGKKGLFKEIVYSDQASDRERVHFDDGTGNIVIHIAEPTVSHHVGLAGQYKHLLDSQTLVAELVTQCVAQEIARRKLESGARVYFDRSAAGQMQEDLAEIRHLVHTYGPSIHRVVVDQQLLKGARRAAQENRGSE